MSDNPSGFQAEINSKFEPLLLAKVCEPVLQRIPLSVNPNTISLGNHLICWFTGIAAYLSAHLSPPGRALALIFASLGTFSLAVGDCLDGMQARRTNRCSKLGEMLDHWLDAIHQPMVTFGVAIALQLEPWMAAALHITATMIYNAQLVLYHRTRKFVHPETSGTDAQVGTTIGYLVAALLFSLFDPQHPWIRMVILVAVIVAVIMQLKLNLFYYRRLKGLVIYHLPFVVFCGGFAALYLLGVLGQVTFLLCVVFCSFRITGSFVLFTLIQRPFKGIDLGLGLLLLSLFAGHFWLAPIPLGGTTLQALLPAITCAYMIGRNLIDFTRHRGELRPKAA